MASKVKANKRQKPAKEENQAMELQQSSKKSTRATNLPKKPPRDNEWLISE